MFSAFTSHNASQRESYAVAGLIGIILSDFNYKNPLIPEPVTYDETPVIKPKYDALPRRKIKSIADCEQTLKTDYDFSQITPEAFKLDVNSDEAKLLNAMVSNLKEMSHQDPGIRNAASSDNYKKFMDNVYNLTKLELTWLQKLVNDLEKAVGKFNARDPKHQAIKSLIDFYKENVENKDHIHSSQIQEVMNRLTRVIETSADKQEKKLFGSTVLKIVNNDLPKKVLEQLPEKQQGQIKELKSTNIFRLFERKKETAKPDLKEQQPTQKPVR